MGRVRRMNGVHVSDEPRYHRIMVRGVVSGMSRTDIEEQPSTSLDPLRAALGRLPGFGDVAADALEPMRVKGLVHEHIRVRGRGVVLRVPHWSQFGLAPADNLAYQTACFERAAPSGATPRLRGVIPIQPGLPYGALVVDDIVGRAPRLPDDMGAIADCLAAIHKVPVPPEEGRAPLFVHADPVAGALDFIDRQAAYLPDSGIAADARRQIDDEIAWARAFAAEAKGRDHPITLVGTDTHPGNFLVDDGGRAVFVDLEKALYGSPAIDLAHASIYTSTMWDAEIATPLDPADVHRFYDRYLGLVPEDLAERLRPWLTPLRRLTWLRTTTWCAKWTVESTAADQSDGQQSSGWAARRRDPALIGAVRARIADYFDPKTIARIRREWS